MASVTLRDVCKTYISRKEKVKAVKELSLEVKEGEFMCLLGPSGCGKTSSMRMIVGLEDVTSGEIYIGDRLVNNLSPQERNIAMSFETYALYTHLSVRGNILFPLNASKTSPDERQRRLARVVEMLEIEDLLERGPSQLSGGQQQRVSLARALIREPDVFLLDEPLSHLDVTLRTSTRAQIKHLHEELKTTFIYVTHDQLEAISLADRIAVMNFAELQQVGTREELLNLPINRFVADFIGEPAINFFECDLISNATSCSLKSVQGSLEIPVFDKWIKRLKEHGNTRYILGIRPHDILPKPTGSTTQISGIVDVFEFLGEENHVTATIDGDLITVVVSPFEFYKVNDSIDIHILHNCIHIFDTETGDCLSTQYKKEDVI